MSKILIVTVSLKYLLQEENRDVSMKSMMINSGQLPQWPESTSSGSLDVLSPEEHENLKKNPTKPKHQAISFLLPIQSAGPAGESSSCGGGGESGTPRGQTPSTDPREPPGPGCLRGDHRFPNLLPEAGSGRAGTCTFSPSPKTGHPLGKSRRVPWGGGSVVWG